MRNKVVILTLSFIMVLCSSFSVFGASRSYSFPMTEPATSDTQGYLVVTNPTMTMRNVFYWSIQPYAYSDTDKTGSLPSMNIVLNDSSIEFNALCTGSARVTLTRVYNDNSQQLCISRGFTTSTSYSYAGMSDVEYYFYNGNIGIVDDNLSSGYNFLNVTWGEDEAFQQQFDELVVLIQDTYDRIVDMRLIVEDIAGYNQSILSVLDDLLLQVESLVGYAGDIKDILLDINGVLNDCYTELKSIDQRLEDANIKLDDVNTELDGIHSDLNERLDDVNEELDDIHSTLKKAINQLGKEDTSSLDDSSIGSLGDDEDAVLSDESSKLDDLSFSFGNAFDVVWDLISEAWQANSKVFTLVIMCLTVGLIKLILNR